jgi:hypothetical protein
MRYLLIPALASALAMFASPAACAASTNHSAKSDIDFRIVVPRVLRLNLAGQPRAITVTQSDVERGEVVVRGTHVEMVGNDRRGFRVRTELTHAAFTGLALNGLANPIEAQERVAVVWMRPTIGRPAAAAEVEYRFRLAADAAPGQYPWPLQLTLEDA